jgi:phosphoribosylaminoimidazole carboxylase (NCAIR synthetase)
VTTVGVVSGGQLARMLHQAAISLGVQVVVLDPDPRCSAALAGAGRFDGTWTSVEDLLAFARSGFDVVTFDHEPTAPADVATLGDASPVAVRPAAATKLLAQDKRVARETFAEQGLPVPGFAAVARWTTSGRSANATAGRWSSRPGAAATTDAASGSSRRRRRRSRSSLRPAATWSC